MRAITFLFVDQSSPCRLENFSEDTPTRPEVINSNTLNFKPNFKFSQLKLGGPLGVCASKPWSISSACKSLRGQQSQHP